MDLKYRKQWLVIGWCLIALAWYLSLTPTTPEPFKLWDKMNHFIAYACLMAWFGQLYKSNRIRIMYAVGFVIMGIAIEFFQGMGPHRVFEYNDMLANTLGVFIAVIVIYLKGDGILYWIEQRVLNVS